MDKFIFPLNYKYSPKLLGIIEYKILLPIAAYLGFIIFILYSLKVDFFIGFGIIIFFGVPPVIILSMGTNGQPTVPFIKAVFKYTKSNKLYIYKKK